jgi:hypothetical protein
MTPQKRRDMVAALSALDRLLTGLARYVGPEIHIPCESHDDAMRRMGNARDALDALKLDFEERCRQL